MPTKDEVKEALLTLAEFVRYALYNAHLRYDSERRKDTARAVLIVLADRDALLEQLDSTKASRPPREAPLPTAEGPHEPGPSAPLISVPWSGVVALGCFAGIVLIVVVRALWERLP